MTDSKPENAEGKEASWLEQVKVLLYEKGIKYFDDGDSIGIDFVKQVEGRVASGEIKAVDISEYSLYISEKQVEIVISSGLVGSSYDGYRIEYIIQNYENELNDFFNFLVEDRYGFTKGYEGYQKDVATPGDAVATAERLLSLRGKLVLRRYLLDCYQNLNLAIAELDKLFA